MKTEIKKEYYQNGKLCSETPYKNDKRHGIRKFYYENGKLKSSMNCLNGRIYGIYITFS